MAPPMSTIQAHKLGHRRFPKSPRGTKPRGRPALGEAARARRETRPHAKAAIADTAPLFAFSLAASTFFSSHV